MNFRKDINGLRAIAVLVVVLFHFAVPGFSGGFVGVDIFFVISGYLMTAIIFKRLQGNDFSFWDFFFARAKRIVPALAVVCLCLLIGGWLFLAPADYRQLGKHVAGALLFISNIQFFLEAGYFDQSSHDKWLLHTWSLSVEWQFYMLYPLLLMLAARLLPLSRVRQLLLPALLLSLGLSVVLTPLAPSAAFYLLPTRAWEMLAGGLIFAYPLSLSALRTRVLEGAGLLLIVCSVVLLAAADAWPGWRAMFPVLGTCMVIAAARRDSWLAGNALLQGVGAASYSIYLWHWPVVVLMIYFDMLSSAVAVVAGILLSFILGFLSWRYIERLMERHWMPAISAPLKTLCIALSVCGLAACVWGLRGVPERMPDSFVENTSGMQRPFRANGWCFYNVDSNSDLVMGQDGHADLWRWEE